MSREMEDEMMDRELTEKAAEPEIEEELWVTQDDQALPVGAMEETHVRNALRMLIRQIRKGDLTCLGGHKKRITRARRLAGWE